MMNKCWCGRKHSYHYNGWLWNISSKMVCSYCKGSGYQNIWICPYCLDVCIPPIPLSEFEQ